METQGGESARVALGLNDEQPTPPMGCRLKRGDDASGTLRLREVEGLPGRGSRGGEGEGLAAGAYVAEEPPAGEWVAEEGDAAAAAVSAVGAAEDEGSECALKEVGPGAAVRGLGLLGEVGRPVGLGKIYDLGAREFRSDPTGKHRGAEALSAASIDWDADGDIDLVLGEVDGRLFLYRNEGTKAEPSLCAVSERLRAGAKSMWVVSGHSMPVATDWDGGGRFDLLSGASDGSVTLWLNTGTVGAPTVGEPEILVAPSPEQADPARPGWPSQPHVADFDGDLLVGDYRRVGVGAESKALGFVWLYRRVRASD